MVAREPQDLLIFTLGPVQPFIATARRTQDLWLGSQLLSNLALVGLQRADTPQTAFIYPTKLGDQWPDSIPNRFVVAVPAGQGKVIGPAIAQSVERAWLVATEKVRNFFGRAAPEDGWQNTWNRQAREWLETYWVAWPWDGGDYGTTYRQAGLALDARKQVRHFPTSFEHGEVCTLCGLRQALHGQEQTRREVRRFWSDIRQHPQIMGAELREGERLCAVCTVKRFATRARVQVGGRQLKPEERFPSTSSIAAATFKAALFEKWGELQDPILTHLDALDSLRARSGAPFAQPEDSPFLKKLVGGRVDAQRLLCYDGDFFYRESLADERLVEVLGREPTAQDRERIVRARGTLNGLLKVAGEQKIAPLHSYLVILALDGDLMGRLLGQCHSPDEHRAISDALVTFSQNSVYRIVEQEHAGRVVYAGGDDLLALLPVGHALSAANALRQAFTRALQQAEQEGRTASVGLAITHHIHPLESALRAARRAEISAKNSYGRNALVIEVLRRSGERAQVGLNWSYPDGPADALAVVNQVSGLFANQTLSGKLAYDLRDEAPALIVVPQAHEAEQARLLTRHWQLKPVETHRPAIQALAAQLTELCQVGRVGIESLAEWLLLARFLAQGGSE